MAAGERARLFRQNVASEFKRLRWARSATKHRISRTRIHDVLEHCALIFEKDPPARHPGGRDLRWVFLGEDSTSVALEVIAVEADDGNLVVIHAMKMRSRYRDTYEEVGRCNK